MDRQAVKDLMYGGLMEIMRNREYYYHSGVGSHYSHFTDRGKEAINEYVSLISGKMFEAEQAELDKRAKDLVIKELKGS